jgi:hypothetical protein
MSTAAFTIARNEPLFLPLWLTYYSRRVDALFVLDHESDDGSTEGLPCRVVRVSNGGRCFDHAWLCATATTFQTWLLQSYEQVIYSDVDEFLCHPDGLGAFLAGHRGSSARARGYHLVQDDQEAPYEPTRPIMEQRATWRPDPLYDKSLVSRVPLKWDLGFHRLEGLCHAPFAEGLTLVHLHQFDRAACHERHAERLGWQWDEGQLQTRNGEQWRLERDALDQWLDAGLAGAEAVPEWVRGQF